jgi:nucleotide-binding universal stress UspA family protein
VSAASTRSRTPDRLCAEAVDLARAAAEEAAAPGVVGEHAGTASEGDRVVTHLFECKELGYRGWRWAVTVARASRAKLVTLDEVVLLPGPDALLAPEWVPWSERLRPGDMGPGDLLPTDAEDLRLEPGYTGEDEPVANSPVSEEMAELAEAEDADVSAGTLAHLPFVPSRGSIAAVAEELGMRRARVLSRYGLHVAADRWEETYGAKTPMAQAAPATCVSCGFLTPVGGSLGQAFGVCANEFSPADGRIVSLAYGCGGHSEAAVMPKPPQPPPPVIDETRLDPFPLRPSPDSGSVPTTTDEASAELGHS